MQSKFRISKWNRSSTWLLIFWSQRLAGIKLYFMSSKSVKFPRVNLFTFIKNLFEPLPQLFWSTQQWMLKRQGRLEDFYASFKLERLSFLSIFAELKLKQFPKSPIYSSVAMQYVFYYDMHRYRVINCYWKRSFTINISFIQIENN